MDVGQAPTPEPPSLVCARLLACGGIRYDPADPDAGYSLERVLVHVRPAGRQGFPFRLPRICLFAQLHGTPGDYVLRVRMVRIGLEDGEAVELDEPVHFGPWEIELPGGNYVECYGIPLTDVPFPESGVYEFQLWADGFDRMLMNERVEARE
jgi:hypothetical protein